MLRRVSVPVFYQVAAGRSVLAAAPPPQPIPAPRQSALQRFAVQGDSPLVRLMGCGTILREVIAAVMMRQHDWGISSEGWSGTGYSELARDAAEVERWNRLHPQASEAHFIHVQQCLHSDGLVDSSPSGALIPTSGQARVKLPAYF